MSSKQAHFTIKKRRKTRPPAGNSRNYRLSRNKERKPISEVLEYFKRNLLINEAIKSGPDTSLYTWILREPVFEIDRPALYRQPSIIIAAPTISEQELGTLHTNLDMLTANILPGTIVAAGEFKKEGDHILFNLQSGSFMKALFGKRKPDEAKLEIRDGIIERVTDAFLAIGLRANFNYSDTEPYSGNPMIDPAEIITNYSKLHELDSIMSYNELNESNE